MKLELLVSLSRLIEEESLETKMQFYIEIIALFILSVYLSTFVDVACLSIKIHDNERREKRDLNKQNNTLKGIYIKLKQRQSLHLIIQ